MSARGHVDEVRFIDPLARKLDPAGTGRIPEGSSAYLRGWGYLTDPSRAAAAALASVDGGEPFELAYNQGRPDVLKVLGLPPMLPIGFHGVRSLRDLTCGPHVLRVALADRSIDALADIGAEIRFEIVPAALAFPATQRLGRDQIVVEVDEFPDACAAGAPLAIRGWAVDRRYLTAASDVYACIDDALLVRGIIGTLRADVAGEFGAQCVARCGYVVRVDTTALASGRHVLEIRAIAADGERYAPSKPLAFTIT